MRISTKAFILMGIFVFSFITFTYAAGTTLRGNELTYNGVGLIRNLETIDLDGNPLFIVDSNKSTIIAMFNADPLTPLTVARGLITNLSFPNTTISFLGDVNNFDDINSFSRFSETNLNNGTNASSGFNAVNDEGFVVNFGIGSSNFMIGNESLSNQPAIVSFSPEGLDFINGLNGSWRWRSNPGTPERLTITELDEFGNYEIQGNFTGNQFYGEMFVEGNVVPTSISTIATYTMIDVLLEGSTNGFVYSSSELIVGVNGIYKVDYGITFSDANNKDYRSTIGIDSSPQEKCISGRRIANIDFGNMGSSCLLELTEGQNVSLMIANLDGTQDPTVEDANINLVRIGS